MALETQIHQDILESINERFKAINERLASQEGIRPIQKLILLVYMLASNKIQSKAVNQEIVRIGLCFPTSIVVSSSSNAIQIKDLTAETCLKYLVLEVPPLLLML